MRKNGTRRCGSQGVTRSGLLGKMPVFLIRRSLEGGLSAWTGAEFQRSDALIFVGACGIAVRAIAPFVQDKFHDPAVLCVDEAGTFVIPLLSGHVGGANRLAEFVAGGIGAVPVVTTATDVETEIRSGCLCKGSRACDHRPGTCKKDLGGYSCGVNRLACSRISAFQRWKKIPEGLFRGPAL